MSAARNPAPPGVLLVVALGGALGSLVRWAVGLVAPTSEGVVPWSTLAVNVGGSLAVGLLMVLVVDVLPAQRYVRAFWGVGVLGGFTTFSAYAVELRQLLVADAFVVALGYLTATVVLGLMAAAAGLVLGRRWYGGRRRAAS